MNRIKPGCIVERHEVDGGCYNCCEACNYVRHICPGCGNDLSHDGRDIVEPNKGKYHVDCMGEWVIENGKFVRLTEFGERMLN